MPVSLPSFEGIVFWKLVKAVVTFSFVFSGLVEWVLEAILEKYKSIKWTKRGKRSRGKIRRKGKVVARGKVVLVRVLEEIR